MILFVSLGPCAKCKELMHRMGVADPVDLETCELEVWEVPAEGEPASYGQIGAATEAFYHNVRSLPTLVLNEETNAERLVTDLDEIVGQLTTEAQRARRRHE